MVILTVKKEVLRRKTISRYPVGCPLISSLKKPAINFVKKPRLLHFLVDS